MGDRSDLRIDVHDLLTRLQKDGMSEEEMFDQLPYLGKQDIKHLLRNEP